MPSKKIILKRAKPFQHESITSEAMQQQLAYTRRGLGSYFKSKDSQKSGSGLTQEEEKTLMPLILSIPHTDPEFWKEVDRYFTEINTKAPFGNAGLELEIGQLIKWVDPTIKDSTGKIKKTLDGGVMITHLGCIFDLKEDGSLNVVNGALIANNMPVNIDDYIRYRHALKHPFCAPSVEDMEGNKLVQYYLEDPSAVLDTKTAALAEEDAALVDYAGAKNDPNRVKMLVTLMRHLLKPKMGSRKIDPDSASPQELAIALKELAIQQPKKFHEAASDENVKKRYFIDSMLTAGILTRIGNAIVDTENNTPLGDTIAEAIFKIYDGKNTALYNSLKQRLKNSGRGAKALEVLAGGAAVEA